MRLILSNDFYNNVTHEQPVHMIDCDTFYYPEIITLKSKDGANFRTLMNLINNMIVFSKDKNNNFDDIMGLEKYLIWSEYLENGGKLRFTQMNQQDLRTPLTINGVSISRINIAYSESPIKDYCPWENILMKNANGTYTLNIITHKVVQYDYEPEKAMILLINSILLTKYSHLAESYGGHDYVVLNKSNTEGPMSIQEKIRRLNNTSYYVSHILKLISYTKFDLDDKLYSDYFLPIMYESHIVKVYDFFKYLYEKYISIDPDIETLDRDFILRTNDKSEIMDKYMELLCEIYCTKIM